jgi:subtilisin family serine protease
VRLKLLHSLHSFGAVLQLLPEEARLTQNGTFSADLLAIIDKLEDPLSRGGEEIESGLLAVNESPELFPILLLSEDQKQACDTAEQAGQPLRQLANGVLAGELTATTLRNLQNAVQRGEMMKEHTPLLEKALPAIGLPLNDLPSSMKEIDGRGVLVAVIDTGFDLAHPCFRDAENNLRVEALLDQTSSRDPSGWRSWTGVELQTSWNNPAATRDGHGTHVASIAAGSPFGLLGYRGIALGARFLLVKSDMIHFTEALEWVYKQAQRLGLPCVVNYSAGHHDGAHDGTHVDEGHYLELFTKPGLIFVAAAGNSGEGNIHVSATLNPGVSREISFRAGSNAARLKISGWYSIDDEFEVEIVGPPNEKSYRCPSVANPQESFPFSGGTLTMKRSVSPANQCIEVLIELRFSGFNGMPQRDSWMLKFVAGGKTQNGTIDFWIANNGGGEFMNSDLIVPTGTVTMPATSAHSIAVGSFGSKSSWSHDGGIQSDANWLAGVSRFSSRGPTRMNLQKPDLVAPGEWITAACSSSWRTSSPPIPAERVWSPNFAMTNRGTSMAAPFVTGVIALMLQVNKNLTSERARAILTQTAQKQKCVCKRGWCNVCGYGFLDALAAVQETLKH